MLSNHNSQYLGIIEWYDKVKDFGSIQSENLEEELRFKSNNLKNPNDAAKIKEDAIVLFTIKPNRRGRLVAENVSFDYAQYLVSNFPEIDDKTIQLVLSGANEQLKEDLQEQIKRKGSRNKEETDKHLNIAERAVGDLNFLGNILKSNDATFNSNLIKTLAEGIGKIKNESTYQSAKELVFYNSQAEIPHYPELSSLLYQNANNHFKFKLWLEGIVQFCDLEIIRKRFENGDDELKDEILARCNSDEKGFLIKNAIEISKPNEVEEVYFSGIRNIILREIYNTPQF